MIEIHLEFGPSCPLYSISGVYTIDILVENRRLCCMTFDTCNGKLFLVKQKSLNHLFDSFSYGIWNKRNGNSNPEFLIGPLPNVKRNYLLHTICAILDVK